VSAELRSATDPRHLLGDVDVPPVFDLVATPTERAQVLPTIVGRVGVDMVPVQALRLATPLAARRLRVQPVGLGATAARRPRPLRRPRRLGNASLRLTDRITDALRATGAGDGVPLALGSAGHAERGVARDRRAAVGAAAGPLARLAPRGDTSRPVASPSELGNCLCLLASATPGRLHAEKSTEIPSKGPCA